MRKDRYKKDPEFKKKRKQSYGRYYKNNKLKL